MIFRCSTNFDEAILIIDGDRFFPTTQANIRKLYAQWIQSDNMSVGRDIIEYLAKRMDRIKARWMEKGLDIQEWPSQYDAREYRKLERNLVLLNTLYSGGSRYV